MIHTRDGANRFLKLELDDDGVGPSTVPGARIRFAPPSRSQDRPGRPDGRLRFEELHRSAVVTPQVPDETACDRPASASRRIDFVNHFVSIAIVLAAYAAFCGGYMLTVPRALPRPLAHAPTGKTIHSHKSTHFAHRHRRHS